MTDVICSWTTPAGLQPPSLYLDEAYQGLFAAHDAAEPRIVACRSKHAVSFLPVLVRDIGSGVKEAYSAYGYGGFWGTLHLQSEGLKSLALFLAHQSIVALFIRHAPFLSNQEFVPEASREFNRQTFGVSLKRRETFDEYLQAVNQKLRWSVKAAMSTGAKVTFHSLAGIDCSRIADFYDLYAGLMRQKGTAGYYLFSARFFQEHAIRLGANCELAEIRDSSSGKLLAGAFFLLDRHGRVHYHLSASGEAAKKTQIMELLLAAAIHRYGNAGYEMLNLGGGHKADASDGLSRFKRKFADLSFPFYCTKLVCDDAAYALERNARPLQNPGFFLIADARGL